MPPRADSAVRRRCKTLDGITTGDRAQKGETFPRVCQSGEDVIGRRDIPAQVKLLKSSPIAFDKTSERSGDLTAFKILSCMPGIFIKSTITRLKNS